MATLEEAKQFLKQDKNGKGTNLYDHLSDVLLKILVEKPTDAYDTFENLSAAVKKTTISPDVSSESATDVNDEATTEMVSKQQLSWTSKTSGLLTKPDEPVEGGPSFPSLVQDASLMEWAGISFGPSETYRLFLSIKAFAATLDAGYGQIRFWGRISTRSGYYYIIEGTTYEDPEEIDLEKQEGLQGVNKHTYWVATSTASAWTQLPFVTSAQITSARQLTYYMTGDLEASVPGYPPFPGKEANLLATQVVLISSGAVVVPEGLFKIADEDEVDGIIPNDDEDFTPKTSDELKDLSAWAHLELDINSIGRSQPLPEILDSEGEPIERENPDILPPLRSLADDEESSWAIRSCPGGSGEGNDSIIVVRSLKIPGAYAISNGTKKFLNVYVGDGVAYKAKPYMVPFAPPLQSEWAPAEDEEIILTEAQDILVDPTPAEEEE